MMQKIFGVCCLILHHQALMMLACNQLPFGSKNIQIMSNATYILNKYIIFCHFRVISHDWTSNQQLQKKLFRLVFPIKTK